ncbi:MAG: hypothetical protein WCL61_01435 [bacterium]
MADAVKQPTVNPEAQLSEVIYSWNHPEYVRYEKDVRWYVISVIVLVLLAWYCYAQNNWLFFVLMLIGYLIVLIEHFRPVKMIDFVITPDGIKTHEHFYFYKDLKHFYIVYEDAGLKNLYFDFQNPLLGRLVIPIDGQDAIGIRQYLLNFLDEDLQMETEPWSETIRRLFRL